MVSPPNRAPGRAHPPSRSKYETPGSPPDRWRPSRLTKMLLGIVPGVRTMALEDARRGLPFAVLGLLLALAFLLIATSWDARQGSLMELRLVQSLELFDGLCLLLIVLAYEGLRLVSALEERTRRPWAPRVVAAPFLPALLVVVLGPDLVHHWPRGLEALWWAAIVLLIGSSPALAFCLLEDQLITKESRKRWVLGWASGLGALVVILVLISVFVPSTAHRWSEDARSKGFRLLPLVLTLHRDS